MVLVGKPEGKRQSGPFKHRWLDNIKMNLKERGCERAAMTVTVQGGYKRRILANTVMNVWGT